VLFSPVCLLIDWSDSLPHCILMNPECSDRIFSVIFTAIVILHVIRWHFAHENCIQHHMKRNQCHLCRCCHAHSWPRWLHTPRYRFYCISIREGYEFWLDWNIKQQITRRINSLIKAYNTQSHWSSSIKVWSHACGVIENVSWLPVWFQTLPSRSPPACLRFSQISEYRINYSMIFDWFKHISKPLKHMQMHLTTDVQAFDLPKL